MEKAQKKAELIAALRTQGLTSLTTVVSGVRDGYAVPLDAGLIQVLHDVAAHQSVHAPAANAFALSLALRLNPAPLIWVIDTRASGEVGGLYASGLHEWGVDCADVLVVQVSGALALLAAGEEAMASGAARAVILSAWGESPAYTLTASRRLTMAAVRGGTTGFFVRAAALPAPSAAETRWSVGLHPQLRARAAPRDAPRSLSV